MKKSREQNTQSSQHPDETTALRGKLLTYKLILLVTAKTQNSINSSPQSLLLLMAQLPVKKNKNLKSLLCSTLL